MLTILGEPREGKPQDKTKYAGRQQIDSQEAVTDNRRRTTVETESQSAKNNRADPRGTKRKPIRIDES